MGRIWKSPFVRLVAYYVLLSLVTLLIVSVFPQIRDLFNQFQELSPVHGSGGKGKAIEAAASGPGPGSLGATALALITMFSMIGALALMLPTAWVYMTTKQQRGYDQSVVQTVIVLPMTVAGTLILVQNSLALAFALGGIVAAIRFRNTLKDTKDVVYIYLALGVGLAAGVYVPVVAAVMSLIFNLTVLALWKLNVGNIYADQGVLVGALPPAEGLLGPRRRLSAQLAVGDPQLLAALAPNELEEVADRAARLQAYITARSDDKKGERFQGVLLVHTTESEAAQRVVEGLLETETVRWRLAEILPAGSGRSTLEYLLRLKEGVLAASLLNALKSRGTPPIDAAEYRSLRGLRRGKGE
ncbi:MAG TPA: DUF4956 domain-containing protein, partial [Gemmatimonadales bacterium]|nr:DUF4956 domain-containing protein [Gemmatimonadales bacterium]